MSKIKEVMLKGYCKVASFKQTLSNNKADENVSKVVWIMIVFLLCAVLVGLLVTAFQGSISTWFNQTVSNWFPAAGETRPTV